MLAQRLNLIFIVQHASALDDKVDFFLAVVGHGPATTVRIQIHFPEASYGLERSIVFVALTENRAVVASLRGEVGLRLR
ncbi:MAG TPA: hypothetical protein VFF64_12355 [Candidatus Eremiobacteraceae bacterium]|nr:hypothetical protein [Candidatus Eremiobacteraceae bacterium]